MRNSASSMALGGIMAALAVVIMALGTIIPVATYTCPVLCMLLLRTVLHSCGSRLALAWHFAVAILSLLLAPDKEAAIVYAILGYYPILKPWLDKRKGKMILKALFFNANIFTAYYFMLQILGLDQVSQDLSGAGFVMTAVLVILGNVTFFLLDRLLGMKFKRLSKRGN